MRTLLLGGPGTGKTNRVVQLVEQALQDGVPPNQIAVVAFTNQAADEVRARCEVKFDLKSTELPYFRTLHSLCFRQLGMRSAEVMGGGSFKELGEILSEHFTGRFSVDGPALGGAVGDRMMQIDQYARATRTSWKNAWSLHGEDIDMFQLERFVKTYKAFKQERSLFDFTDMLERALTEAEPLKLKLAVVDEAQDMNALQWEVIWRLLGEAEQLVVAGDDDQAVHTWAGAAVDVFLGLDFKKEVLRQNHRLPREIMLAANKIVARLSSRHEKDYEPMPGSGHIENVRGPEDVDLANGSWLVLARTHYQLTDLEKQVRGQGFVYSRSGKSAIAAPHIKAIQGYEAQRAGQQLDEPTRHIVDQALVGTNPDKSLPWHDALIGIPLETREYYLSCRRRGEKLLASPRIRLETIHGAKGLQAEHVLLLTDMSHRVWRGYEMNPDSEHRVFYVGATRASKSLHIVEPTSPTAYMV